MPSQAQSSTTTSSGAVSTLGRRKKSIGAGSSMVAAWMCLSSLSTGAKAFSTRHHPTRSVAFVHSLRSTTLQPTQGQTQLHKPRWLTQNPTRLAVSTADDTSTASTAYDTLNKERGLDKYDPSAFENEIYQWWEQSGCFDPDAKQQPYEGQKSSYVLPMPPPNVTGRLHMGHAIFVALQDVLARFHRMRGRPVLWLPGTTESCHHHHCCCCGCCAVWFDAECLCFWIGSLSSLFVGYDAHRFDRLPFDDTFLGQARTMPVSPHSYRSRRL